MRYVNIEDVLPGASLGKEIFSMDGQVLLSKGASLTANHIARLRKFGVHIVPLDLPEESNFEEEAASPKTQIDSIFEEDSLRFIGYGEEEWKERVLAVMEKVVETAKAQEFLQFIRNGSDSLYAHALMVGLISTTIGARHGYSDKKLEQLAISALLHDIGKVLPASYDEPGVVHGSDHTWRGYNFLKTVAEFGKVVAHVALCHHEDFSQTGHPRKVAASAVHEFAQIVAIANAFDHLTHRRNGEALMEPGEACEFMLAFTNKRFSHVFMNDSLRSVALYPTGSQVVLSNGLHGIVVSQNSGLPQRPVIHILHTNNGGQQITVQTIDLAQENTVFIEEIIS
jgi:HD-GYP domain-containing protein (c-di-GMP phosphodiesterase class II)